jgi:5-methylcytosine-specific restriction endonuclease McrA
LGRGGRKEKKPIPEWKKDIFAKHKQGKKSSGRAEFPDAVVKELIIESEGRCQSCKTVEATTFHHLYPRGRGGRGGRGVMTNGLHLCGICHDIIQRDEEKLQEWISVIPGKVRRLLLVRCSGLGEA